MNLGLPSLWCSSSTDLRTSATQRCSLSAIQQPEEVPAVGHAIWCFAYKPTKGVPVVVLEIKTHDNQEVIKLLRALKNAVTSGDEHGG